MRPAATLAALLIGALVLTGCDKDKSPGEKPVNTTTAPVVPVKNDAPAPASAPLPVAHTECLTDAFGIPLKVVLTERVVILIGDNSGHEPGHPKNPKNISAAQLIDHAKRERVRIFGLCIHGNGGEAEQKVHAEQWHTLAQGTGGASYPLSEAGKMVERIQEIMKDRAAVIDARRTYVSDRARGKTDAQIPLDERLRTE